MIFNIFKFALFLALATFFTSCASIEPAQLKEVTLEERNERGEIVITDEDLNARPITISKTRRTEPTRTLDDNSEIETKYDSHGNKIETRRFKGHSRVDMTVVITSPDKIRQVYVYGFDGTVLMSEEFTETALNASGEEIANVAGLKTTRPFKSSVVVVKPTPTPAKTPPQIRPVEVLPQIQTEETPKPEVQTEETETPAEETRNSRSDEENKSK